MSSSSPATVHILSPDNLFPVELLDGRLRRIARDFGTLKLTVPPGLYLARCEVGGPVGEHLLKADPGEFCRVEFSEHMLPRMPTSAPVLDPLFRAFVSESINALTYLESKSDPRTTARLLLYGSPLGDFFDSTVDWGHVRLRDRAGRLVSSFPSATNFEPDHRVIAIDLPPGGYFLEWPSANSNTATVRMQPLWLCPGWTTFVYASARGTSVTPQPETVSVHMARRGAEVGFDEKRRGLPIIGAELALASLRTGRRQIGAGQLMSLLDSKYENPMLGLLGCYALLCDAQPDRATVVRVWEGLNKLIPAHPDVLALRVLVNVRWHDALGYEDATPIDFPPMLHMGLLGASRAEWDVPHDWMSNPSPVLSDVARLARLRALPDGPWTTFWSRQAPDNKRDSPIDLQSWAQTIAGRFPMITDLLFGEARTEANSLPNLESATDPQTPLGVEAAQAAAEALSALRDYTRKLESETRTLNHVSSAELRPQQLRWAGLSPRQVLAGLEGETLQAPL